jgi:hypothetical protein
MLISVIAVACSSINATYDIDKTADFTKYKTYGFTEDAQKLGIQELDRNRILGAIDAEMSARGLTKSDTPDALIDLFIKLEQKRDATATTTGPGMYGGYGAYGGYGRYGYGGGMSTTHIDVNEYVEGTLFINLVDRGTEKIVWQGRGTKTLDEQASGEKKEKNINAGVKKIFGYFPVKPTTTK